MWIVDSLVAISGSSAFHHERGWGHPRQVIGRECSQQATEAPSHRQAAANLGTLSGDETRVVPDGCRGNEAALCPHSPVCRCHVGTTNSGCNLHLGYKTLLLEYSCVGSCSKGCYSNSRTESSLSFGARDRWMQSYRDGTDGKAVIGRSTVRCVCWAVYLACIFQLAAHAGRRNPLVDASRPWNSRFLSEFGTPGHPAQRPRNRSAGDSLFSSGKILRCDAQRRVVNRLAAPIYAGFR